MTSADKSRAVIITGMHRSGTSLAASLLEHSGINVGSQLIEADTGNPLGYFEDKDFVAFHDRLLARTEQRVFVQDDSFRSVLNDQDSREAIELINRKSGSTDWGWKDPRTSLFLDFWSELLVDPYFVFMIRHPVDVVLSLIRRGFDSELEVIADPLTGLRAWVVYNRSILAFVRDNPSRCLVSNVYSMIENPTSFLDATQSTFGTASTTNGVDQLVNRKNLQDSFESRPVNRILEKIAPDALPIFRELDQFAVRSEQSPRSERRAREGDPRLEAIAELLPDESGNPGLGRALLSAVLAILNPSLARFSGQHVRSRFSRIENQLMDLKFHTENLESLDSQKSTALAESGRLLQRSNKEAQQLRDKCRALDKALATCKESTTSLQLLNDTGRQELEARARKLAVVQDRLAEQNEIGAKLEKQFRREERSRQRDRDRLASLEASVTQYLKHLQACDADREHRQQQVASLRIELETSTDEVALLSEKLRSSAEQIEALRQEIEQTARVAAESHQKLEQRTRRFERIERELGEQIATKTQHLARKAQELDKAKSEIADLGRQLSRKEDQLDQAQQEIRDLESTLDETSRRLEQRDQQLERAQSNIERQEASLQARSDEIEQLEGQLESRREQIVDLQATSALLAAESMQRANDLATIHSSMLWRVADRFWRTIDWLMPPRTWRRKTYDSLVSRLKQPR